MLNGIHSVEISARGKFGATKKNGINSVLRGPGGKARLFVTIAILALMMPRSLSGYNGLIPPAGPSSDGQAARR